MNKNHVGGRRSAAALLSLLLVVAGAVAARAAGPAAGVVISLEGKPQVKRAGAKAAAALKLNDILRDDDIVITGLATRVGISFIGGAELRINENSSFKIESGGTADQPTSVFSRLGNAWTSLTHSATHPNRAGINVRTPSAVCAVRGTVAEVNVAAGSMTTKNLEGDVSVVSPTGAFKATPLRVGQLARLAGSDALPQVRAMTPQDYNHWMESLKAPDVNRSLTLLNAAAVKNRTLNLKMKDRDGKEKNIRLNFEKK